MHTEVKRELLRGVSLAIAITWVLTMAPDIVSAQQLNNRGTLSPGAMAGQNRAIVNTRQQVGTLRSRDTVNIDCSEVAIGVTNKEEKRDLTHERSNQEVIITGSIINICDH